MMKKDSLKNNDDIKREVVPIGHKTTKVGIIPSDWNVDKIGNVTKRIKKSVVVDNSKKYKQIGIRSHSKGIFYKKEVTGLELGNKSVFWIEPNCFIVNIVFAWEQAVAKTTDKEVGMIASHRFPMYQPNEEILSLDYMLYFFKSLRGKHLLGLASPGGAGRNKTLGQKEFARTAMVLPPLIEQNKIAKILSTQDKIIELKVKLLEEKKKQKKYLMQVLLNPDREYFKRLPGFDGDWNTYKLRDICEISTGNRDVKDKVDKGEYPFFIRSEKIERIDEYAYDGEAILIPGDGKIGEIYHYIDGKFNYHQRVYKLSDFNPHMLGKYIFFFLMEHFLKQALSYTAKATVNSLRMPMLTNMVIETPNNVEEQEKIIRVLSVATYQIEALQNEISQQKKKKKALMQLLLTGKVRTING